MNIKYLAIGILVGYLTPYLLEYLKSKQPTQTQETNQDEQER